MKEKIYSDNYEDEYSYQFTLLSGIKIETDYIYKDAEGNQYTKDDLEKFPRQDVIHIIRKNKIKEIKKLIRKKAKIKEEEIAKYYIQHKMESNEYNILIEKDGKTVKIKAEQIDKYLIVPKVFRIDNDFNLTTNKDFFDGCLFSPEGFSEMSPKQRIDLLKGANDDELVKIETLSRKLKGQLKRIPNKETQKRLETINTIRSNFEVWYFSNKLPVNYKTIKTQSKTGLQLSVLKELINRKILKGVTIKNETALSIGKTLVKNGDIKNYKTEQSLIATIRKIAYRDLKYGDPFQSKAIGSKDNTEVIYHAGKTENKDTEHPISKVILK